MNLSENILEVSNQVSELAQHEADLELALQSERSQVRYAEGQLERIEADISADWLTSTQAETCKNEQTRKAALRRSVQNDPRWIEASNEVYTITEQAAKLQAELRGVQARRSGLNAKLYALETCCKREAAEVKTNAARIGLQTARTLLEHANLQRDNAELRAAARG